MLFKVVTWNMDWRGHGRSAPAAWSFLREELKADVALLQECVPPQDLSNTAFQLGGIGGRRPWGSAVVSFGRPLTEVSTVRTGTPAATVDLRRTFPGALRAGKVVLSPSGGPPIVFVSVYGLMEGGYAVTTLNKMLSDLTFLMDSRLGRYVVVGGDLNCSTQFPGRDRARHVNLFDRVTSLGLIDALLAAEPSRPPLEGCPCEDDPCRHQQTLRHRSSTVPWQNDYLFATAGMIKRLVSAKVVRTGTSDPWSLSDHLPIMAIFDLPGRAG